MQRRKALGVMGALALAPLAVAAEAGTRQARKVDKVKSGGEKHMLNSNEYLSKTNPLASIFQRDAETQAVKLLDHPKIVAARERAKQRLLGLCGDRIPDEVKDRIDVTMHEWSLHYLFIAMNCDANYPKVLRNLFEPDHEWFGLKVPGNRTLGGENWDNTYNVIPIDAYGRFELRGQLMDNPAADGTFSVMGNIVFTMTMDNMPLQEVNIEKDGSFVITIGPEPAPVVNGRRANHLQTKPDARYILIRDTRSDWRQSANALSVRRLTPPLAPPMTLEQKIDHAAMNIVEDLPANHWFMVTPTLAPVNVVPQPFSTGAIGGQVTQGITQAHFKIADDEAYVINVSGGIAAAQVITLYDYWCCKMDWRRTTSLNISQTAANPDGSYTYVIAHQDPGVHNWIDTTGIHEPRVFIRFHGMPPTAVAEGKLWTTGELVKLKDLDRALPPTMKRVTPEERKQQLAERVETFLTRYVV